VVEVDIFDAPSRKDRAPRRANEPSFAFLNRTGSRFFSPVRELFQIWLEGVPMPHRASIVGELRSGDDEKFDSAFWELYLHRVLTGSGFDVTIHPTLPDTTRQPDFLVHADEPFYLEAVSVGTSQVARKRKRRLSEVEAVLDSARVEGWTLSFNWHDIGPDPLPSARVRDTLLSWLGNLDHGSVALTFDGLPTRRFAEAGWDLEFTALPVTPGRVAHLVGIRGAGRAAVVDNQTGLRRVLESKSKRYGTDLLHPLVTAVLSNTEFPTRTYEVLPVLYGLHWLGPAQVTDLSELAEEGHWRTRHGWRRSHNPSVVVVTGLNPYNLQSRMPWSCRSLDPRIEECPQLPWAAPIDLTVPEPPAPSARPDLGVLGVTDDWCSGDPDFDEGA
jgi:hypothetical protein